MDQPITAYLDQFSKLIKQIQPGSAVCQLILAVGTSPLQVVWTSPYWLFGPSIPPLLDKSNVMKDPKVRAIFVPSEGILLWDHFTLDMFA